MFWRRVFFLLTRAERAEVHALTEHVLRVLTEEADGRSDANASHLPDWVQYRFAVPLEELLRRASFDARVHTLINIVVIAGGFATSGIAVAAGGGEPGSALSWIVFAIGLLVALAGGVSQTFRPGQRASARQALGEELRSEGWALVNNHGRYRKPRSGDDPSRFEVFNERVSDIHRRTTEVRGLEGGPAEGSGEKRDE